MKNIHLPVTKRLIVVTATALVVVITAFAAHQRAEAERIRADIRKIDNATAQLALY